MNFETKKDAIRWRRHDRRALRRGKRRHRQVARMLGQCKTARCGTEACRVCMRNFRIDWIGEGTKIMIQRPTWTRCSIIPARMLVPYGKLRTFDVAAEVKRIRKRIQRSRGLRGRIILGAFDISLNLQNNVIQGWQVHLYLIVEGHDDRKLRSAIKLAFPPEPTALVPYDFIGVTDPLKVIGYAYKAVMKRRSAWVNKTGGHHSKPQPLKGPDLRELLPFLAKHKVGARLILSGVRRNGEHLVFTTRKGTGSARR